MQYLFEAIGRFFDNFALWVIVDPWERSLRVRRGKKLKVLEPGWHWLIPMLDDTISENVLEETIHFPVLSMETYDGHPVVVRGFFTYEITDMLKLFTSLEDHEEWLIAMVAGQLASAVAEATADEIGKLPLEQAIGTTCKRKATAKGLKIRDLQVLDIIRDAQSIRLLTEGGLADLF